MPQPVKLSDALIDAARSAAEDADRSLAGQIEHWARLGSSIEGALTATDAARVKRAGGRLERTIPEAQMRERLLQSLRLAASSLGHPHLGAVFARGAVRYGTDPSLPGFLVRIDPDGSRTPGRFVGRRFVPFDTDPEAAARR